MSKMGRRISEKELGENNLKIRVLYTRGKNKQENHQNGNKNGQERAKNTCALCPCRKRAGKQPIPILGVITVPMSKTGGKTTETKIWVGSYKNYVCFCRSKIQVGELSKNKIGWKNMNIRVQENGKTVIFHGTYLLPTRMGEKTPISKSAGK